MTINRQNYEEWFLLYVDNELTIHQRMEVEMFAGQHPDLAAELASLQQAVLPPEHQGLGDTSFLKINPGAAIDITNYEEQFLLYVDNELDAAGRQAVEQFITRHPAYQTKLLQLQQAVLTPEPIACPRKSGLYKRESRVVSFYLTRLALAAALLGVLALGWWWMSRSGGKQSHNNTDAVVAKNQPAVVARPGTQQPAPANKPQQANGQQPAPAQQDIAVVQQPNNASSNTALNKPAIKAHTQPEEDVIAQQKFPATGNQQPVTSTLPQQEAPLASVEATVASTQTPVSNAPLNEMALPAVADKTIPASTSSHELARVAYQELNTSEDDRGVYIGSLDINKNKLRGFFKKAGRIFAAKAKTAADDDGQLQLANMKINTRQ